MRNKAALIMMVILIMSVLAGCSGSNSNASSGDGGKSLIIGIDDKFAPMGFRDESNELVGFDIDYARAAAEKMGREVTFQPIDWSSKELELSSGRIDLIWNGYTITDERKEKVLFTKPYLENSQVIVVLDQSDITDLQALNGKNIGLQKLSSALDALNASSLKDQVATVSEYGDNVLALTDLKIGRLDAVVIDEVVAKYYLSKEEGIYRILDESLAPEQYGIGVKKGNEALLDELQKALDTLGEDGTAASISEKWFGEDKVLK